MLLEHLRLWREWNTKSGNPFQGKVDMANIALMGHSRGGEAAATAAFFNRLERDPEDAEIRFHYGYPIKAIVAIAPADGQYKPAGQWRYLDDVSYLTLQGANDADVSSFAGSRQWERVRFSGPGPWFKSELYIYGANHGQFNSVWGRYDSGQPLGWFLNVKPLMGGDQQRRIAKVYISAFLEATLRGRREYQALFRDNRTGRQWLPDTLYMTRYQDASYRPVATYNEDADVTTATLAGARVDAQNFSIWREGRIPFRHGDRDYNGVFLGWNREGAKGMGPVPVYTIALPAGAAGKLGLGPKSVLALSVAVTDDEAPLPGKPRDEASKTAKSTSKATKSKGPAGEGTDFTVELESAPGVSAKLPVSRFAVLPPPFEVRFMKFAAMDSYAYSKSSEPVFQTVEIPLAAFAEQARGFDPAGVRAIRLRFDLTPCRVIILGQVGFSGNLH
jgi:hypothetical protein